ncbi:MAG: hypothetical protein KF816_13635 [Melioribacteraceae bacterium]|nr:hypothetical protein [Melioribacteraceae bacterium]
MSMDRSQRLIISYLTMRRFIGLLGLALPIILISGSLFFSDLKLQYSISGYYYTNMRDFFVGLLCIVSLFLISYQGYEKVDSIVGNIAGFSALGMILFPTTKFSNQAVKVGIFLVDDDISGLIHMSFATIFFFALAYNALFLFTKRSSAIISREKRQRNFLYRVCGVVMILSMALIFIYKIYYEDSVLQEIYPILVFESTALLAFGISWLVKGNTFFKDQKSNFI